MFELIIQNTPYPDLNILANGQVIIRLAATNGRVNIDVSKLRARLGLPVAGAGPGDGEEADSDAVNFQDGLRRGDPGVAG